MRPQALAFVLALAPAVADAQPPAVAKPRISLELVSEAGFPFSASRDWYELFTGLGVDGLRIRAATGRDRVSIESVGGAASRSLRVTGLLTAAGTVRLPGGEFKLRDRQRIRLWLTQVVQEGESLTQPKGSLGLPIELEKAAASDLKTAVNFSTRGIAFSEMVKRLSAQLANPIELDPASAGRDLVAEELEGFAAGTALAIASRSAKLAIEPQRTSSGGLRYAFVSQGSARHAWPIGRPARDIGRAVPELFEAINVEIDGSAASESLASIAERIAAPLLYDTSAIRSAGIRLSEVKVKIPNRRLSYVRILRTILFQARLTMDVREDENGKPFIWICLPAK